MQELERRDQMIMALTEELSARDARINAILSCRAWRWAQRGSRIKSRLLHPVAKLGRLIPFRRNLKTVATGLMNATNPAPRTERLRPEDKGTVLLPAPQRVTLTEAQVFTQDVARADVICFSIVDWNFNFQRPQQIISSFAEHGHRCFYIRLDATLPAPTNPPFSLARIRENVYEIILAAPRPARINQEDISGALAECFLHSLDIARNVCQISEAIAYVMTPSWTSVALRAKALWGWRLVYDCMDEWDGFPGMPRLMSRVEQRLVRRCDLLVVTARKLYEKWKEHDGPKVLAPNAVDLDFYQ
ncbi:MAG TPA: hypothetical protein VKD91_15895, partial [Pyrinomonadaceae bacterium]|nr:hypothetical protein [Pyrinomonadaceae bacterium]